MRLFFGIYLFFLAFVSLANAEIVLDAKSISYSSNTDIIIASGGVTIEQVLENGEHRKLYTEEILYNRKTREIKLLGESIIQEPSGDVISAKNIELDSGFKEAIIEAFVVVLKDSSKIKAMRGEKHENIFTFENASYSPCRETTCSAPLWDIVAEKATYDRTKKKFIYKNVKLRIKGFPIFWTPYFEHPSPEVKRKTGFLTPMVRNMSDVGLLVGVPFYIAIKKDRDLKITPFLSSRKRILISSEYRRAFNKADFDVSASFLSKAKSSTPEDLTRDKKRRWHVDTILKSLNTSNRSVSFRLNRASDVTYKSIYPVDLLHNDSLNLNSKYNDSNVTYDFFGKTYFLTFDSHIYQTDDKTTSPIVLPHINFNVRKADFFTGQLKFDSDSVYIKREKSKSLMFSKDFLRTSNKLSWEKSLNLSPMLIDITSGLRVDMFNVSRSEEAVKTTNKFFPVLENQINVFTPLITKFKNGEKSIWGPKVIFTSVETSNERANFKQREDSVFDNFSDLNFGAINRFGGYDHIENGEKVALGFDSSFYNSKRRWLNIFVGRAQSIGKRQSDSLNGRNSVIGRFVFKPTENLSFRSRFIGFPLFEKSRLFEAGIKYQFRNVSLDMGHLYDKRLNYIQENGLSQLGFKIGFHLNEFWKVSMSKIINMKKKNGKHNLAHGIWATYKDECFDFSLGIFRTNFKDNDIKPRTGIILSVIFKNLGNLVKSSNKHLYDSSIGEVS